MYSLGGHILDSVSDFPYLGLQISDDLKWNKHITTMVSKVSIVLGAWKLPNNSHRSSLPYFKHY